MHEYYVAWHTVASPTAYPDFPVRALTPKVAVRVSSIHMFKKHTASRGVSRVPEGTTAGGFPVRVFTTKVDDPLQRLGRSFAVSLIFFYALSVLTCAMSGGKTPDEVVSTHNQTDLSGASGRTREISPLGNS